MDKKVDYCWAKAVEYTKRAEDASDGEVREFFYRLRDSWVRAANRAEASEGMTSTIAATPAGSPSSLATH
jgi:hypothetical protein